jgi:stearoyl-CoA desaturase (delta-9 desaturase)
VSNPRSRAVDALSLCLLAGMHLSCGLVLVVPFTWHLVGLAAAGYVLRMFAITVGFHRYFSHRAYRTSRAFQFVLALVGTMAMQNGPLWWASWHRRHHRYADTPLDPHSPRLLGWWQAHLGWVLADTKEDLSNVPDLVRYPELRFLDRHRWLPLVGYALGCFAIAGWAGVVWGFLLSTILVFHATCLINSLAHTWGSRRYDTPDDSRNNAVLAFITLGEGWHNNHHHHMASARQGFFWWELDPSYYVIKLLSWLGLVWDIRAPSPHALERRLARRPRRGAEKPLFAGRAGRRVGA